MPSPPPYCQAFNDSGQLYVDIMGIPQEKIYQYNILSVELPNLVFASAQHSVNTLIRFSLFEYLPFDEDNQYVEIFYGQASVRLQKPDESQLRKIYAQAGQESRKQLVSVWFVNANQSCREEGSSLPLYFYPGRQPTVRVEFKSSTANFQSLAGEWPNYILARFPDQKNPIIDKYTLPAPEGKI